MYSVRKSSTTTTTTTSTTTSTTESYSVEDLFTTVAENIFNSTEEELTTNIYETSTSSTSSTSTEFSGFAGLDTSNDTMEMVPIYRLSSSTGSTESITSTLLGKDYSADPDNNDFEFQEYSRDPVAASFGAELALLPSSWPALLTSCTTWTGLSAASTRRRAPTVIQGYLVLATARVADPRPGLGLPPCWRRCGHRCGSPKSPSERRPSRSRSDSEVTEDFHHASSRIIRGRRHGISGLREQRERKTSEAVHDGSWLWTVVSWLVSALLHWFLM